MKRFLVLLFLLSQIQLLHSKEGIWVPIFLEGALMDDMQLNGFKLTAEDIYSVNQSSMKDAVVRFGGGCTAEIISSKGLLLTNHHCGYGTIQSHSSVENDYLTDGYWAETMEDELANPGLTAMFIKRIEDVTDRVHEGVTEDMNQEEKESKVKSNTADLIKEFTEGTHYEAFIRDFFNGNQQIIFVTETFKDVRLVGAPPSSIGKYGFDTDNWVWPRHTGDFSIFRIYADKDNNPAEYSEDNVPYEPAHHFPISLDGYEEGDFTMVYGFPGRTEEYLTSNAVDFIVNVSNPKKIEIRTAKLNVLDEKMRSSDEVRIKYASKQSSTSNAWKKWKGQNKGLKKNHAIEKKQELERKLAQKLELYPDSFSGYTDLIEKLQAAYKEMNEVALARDYYVEIAYFGTDAMRLAYSLNNTLGKWEKDALTEQDIEKLRNIPNGHFKNFDHETDKAVFLAITPIYFNAEDNFYKPTVLKEILEKEGDDLMEYLADIYESSPLTHKQDFDELISGDIDKALKKIQKDDLFLLANGLYEFYKNQISPAYSALNKEVDELNKKYIQLLQLAFPDQVYYPDANGTLRVTYGKVEGMKPDDAVEYRYYTTLDGVIEKYIPDSYEYNLPQRLIDLHASKDFGQYAHENGEMRVCFIASNHTSGGNSGSPVINAEGELIGLNFDRNWEGTMSDINYDINQCRNISVDIRYVLFIVDKFAGSDRLINELTLVSDKEK